MVLTLIMVFLFQSHTCGPAANIYQRAQFLASHLGETRVNHSRKTFCFWRNLGCFHYSHVKFLQHLPQDDFSPTARDRWGHRCTVLRKYSLHRSRHYVEHVPFWMCYKREQKHTFVDTMYNCLPVPSFRHFFQSETMKHPKASACVHNCETPQVKMIRLCEHCALEGICLACILFGLFLPYGLINNARRLNQQLQWWRHQNAKRRAALSCPIRLVCKGRTRDRTDF